MRKISNIKLLFTKKKEKNSEAAENREAGGDANQVFFFIWPYFDVGILNKFMAQISTFA
jgi:hypothetical protein